MPRSKSLFAPLAVDARKGERTRRRIMESAFLAIARDGYSRTTFQTIADRAQISQPLVVKVFNSKDRIFPCVAAELFHTATELTIEHLRKSKARSRQGRLEAYLEASISLFLDNPDLGGFYMNLYALAPYDREIQKLLNLMRSQALGRLQEITGQADSAVLFHDQLTGAILNTIATGESWDLESLKRRLLRGQEL